LRLLCCRVRVTTNFHVPTLTGMNSVWTYLFCPVFIPSKVRYATKHILYVGRHRSVMPVFQTLSLSYRLITASIPFKCSGVVAAVIVYAMLPAITVEFVSQAKLQPFLVVRPVVFVTQFDSIGTVGKARAQLICTFFGPLFDQTTVYGWHWGQICG